MIKIDSTTGARVKKANFLHIEAIKAVCREGRLLLHNINFSNTQRLKTPFSRKLFVVALTFWMLRDFLRLKGEGREEGY